MPEDMEFARDRIDAPATLQIRPCGWPQEMSFKIIQAKVAAYQIQPLLLLRCVLVSAIKC